MKQITKEKMYTLIYIKIFKNLCMSMNIINRSKRQTNEETFARKMPKIISLIHYIYIYIFKLIRKH